MWGTEDGRGKESRDRTEEKKREISLLIDKVFFMLKDSIVFSLPDIHCLLPVHIIIIAFAEGELFFTHT